MGALITAIVLAGRTGAAFAAQLGSMQVKEEIDALATAGISPVQFLVLPRVLALVLMTPLLTIYADLFGIAGGCLVAVSMLDLSITAYVVRIIQVVTVSRFRHGTHPGFGVRRPDRHGRMSSRHAVRSDRLGGGTGRDLGGRHLDRRSSSSRMAF